jgi:hypothetical protein
MEWTGGAPRSTPALGVTRSKEPDVTQIGH